MVQRLLIASTVGVVLVFAGTAYVDAQQAPPKFCGDGIVQAPNDAGVMELCDAGPDGNDVCSPQCGHKLLGWGWFSTAGWISLNRANCNYTLEQTSGFSSPCSSQDVDYFTAVQPDGSIEGWAWSANLGWICFGQTCGLLDAQYGQQVPQTGWIARADAVDPNIEPEIRGWAKMTIMGDRGWISLNCSNSEAGDTCAASDYQSKVGLDSFYSGGTTETRQPTLIGFGWHSTGEAGSLGWVQFSPSTTPPWLQTRRGDVYAGGGIVGSRPRGLFNATYRILGSGGIS